DMIGQYGADAMRFCLVTLTKDGQDTRFAPEKIEAARNFVNKLWNASRFVLSKAGRLPRLDPARATALEDRWILSRLAANIEAARAAYGGYDFSEAAQFLYRFTWNDVCDWYVEAVKPRLAAGDPVAAAVLGRVLADLLALLHPLAPFVTEAVWQRLRAASDVRLAPVLMVASWPDRAGARRGRSPGPRP